MPRDQIDLYRRAKSGEIQNLPSVQQLHEEQEAPAMVADAGANGLKVCLEKIMNRLRKFEYIPNQAM